MARRARESAHFSVKIFSSHLVPLGCGPCVSRTRHPFAALGPRGPSQKIELCSLPVPKQSVGSLRKFDFRRSLGQGGTWQSARFTILRFSFRCGFLCRNAGKLSHRFKVSLLAIYSHQICNQLASYSQCCAIGIPLLPCVFIYQSQIGIRLGANFAASTSTR